MSYNDALLPDATTITPRGQARYILSHVADVSHADYISGAALAGRTASMGFAVPDGLDIEEFAAIGDEVGGSHDD